MLEAYQYSKINPLRWSPTEIERRRAWHCSDHRHSGLNHPRCYDAAHGIEERKGCLDIEAGQLVADFDIVLSWAVKTVGGETWYDHLTPKDIIGGSYDSRIIATLVDTLWKYDRVIGHYCSANRFDIPFIRSRYLWLKARGMYQGSPFPWEGMLWCTDTYSMAKRCLKIASRRQDSVANTVQGEDIKSRIDKDKWMAIKYGSKTQRKDAIEYIVEHNLLDVEQLEGNYIALLPFCKEVRSSI
jgi:hypothetical protein